MYCMNKLLTQVSVLAKAGIWPGFGPLFAREGKGGKVKVLKPAVITEITVF